MTSSSDTPSKNRSSRNADAAVAAVRRHAFAALIAGRTLTATDIAEQAGLPIAQIEDAIERLRETGALEIDHRGQITGAHGLTQRETTHSITGRDGSWHTWCALDAIGIPAALRLDAVIQTSCPTCGAAIRLSAIGGHLSGPEAVVLWIPHGPCHQLINDFCALANLFCDRDHLDTWRSHMGDPAGEPWTLEQAAQHGRRVWTDATEAPFLPRTSRRGIGAQ